MKNSLILFAFIFCVFQLSAQQKAIGTAAQAPAKTTTAPATTKAAPAKAATTSTAAAATQTAPVTTKTASSTTTGHATTKVPLSCSGVHWEYEGVHGPSHWDQLCVDYSPCGGKTQSPVNIVNTESDQYIPKTETDVNKMDKKLQFKSGPTATHILNNGHTLQFNYDGGSSLTVNGETYTLLQFHTHTHSEHAINGKFAPMEIHFVHRNDVTGMLAVVGVMVEEGAENPVLKNLVDHLPTAKDGTYEGKDSFNAGDLMPADKSYFTYSGSLTTPPCSEIVTWIVLEHPIQASKAQIHDFEALEHQNARPLQAIHSRGIKFHQD